MKLKSISRYSASWQFIARTVPSKCSSGGLTNNISAEYRLYFDSIRLTM